MTACEWPRLVSVASSAPLKCCEIFEMPPRANVPLPLRLAGTCGANEKTSFTLELRHAEGGRGREAEGGRPRVEAQSSSDVRGASGARGARDGARAGTHPNSLAARTTSDERASSDT